MAAWVERARGEFRVEMWSELLQTVLLCVVLWGKRVRSASRYPPNGV